MIVITGCHEAQLAVAQRHERKLCQLVPLLDASAGDVGVSAGGKTSWAWKVVEQSPWPGWQLVAEGQAAPLVASDYDVLKE
eukprot:COSAG02_NODE_494_length_21161_cov_48.367534_9_plen_81_part_00